jgi:ElaB/YqjD/DUF883 family membrane-anchored ribosome-binding protein
MESSETNRSPADRARDVADSAREKLSDAAETVRAKTGNLQAQLAGALDSSASALRSRAGSATASTQGDGTPAAASAAAAPLLDTSETVASMMERGAMWLRENDLSELETQLTDQLEQHPVRTLAIAAGIGFLISRRT